MSKYHESHKIKIKDLRPILSKHTKICMECGATGHDLYKPCVFIE